MAGKPRDIDARYEIVCTRLSTAEHREVMRFALKRNIGITAAVRMLIFTGIELLDGGNRDAANISM